MQSAFAETWDAILTQARRARMTDEEVTVLVRGRYIRHVLEEFKGNQCKAANALGRHRNTLARAMHELGINPFEYRASARTRRRRNINR